jgi:hypothetical protein
MELQSPSSINSAKKNVFLNETIQNANTKYLTVGS